MRQTATRAFTQMSVPKVDKNKLMNLDVEARGIDFKLDLMGSCSATAKLERLRSKYQKQAAEL